MIKISTENAENTFRRLKDTLVLEVIDPSIGIVKQYHKVEETINRSIHELKILNMMIEGKK